MKTRDLSQVFTRREEKNIKPYQVKRLLYSALNNAYCPITYAWRIPSYHTVLRQYWN